MSDGALAARRRALASARRPAPIPAGGKAAPAKPGADAGVATLLGRVAGWPLWLGGSVAGLSALFYAAGYLLFHAHLNMLGIGGMIEQSHDQMLLEGARFFFSDAGTLFRDGLEPGLVLAVGLAAVAVAREVDPIDRRIRRLTGRVAARHAAMLARHPARDRTILLALLVGLVYLHFSAYFDPLQSLGQVSSLLFRTPLPATATGCPPPLLADDAPLAQWATYWIMLAHAGRSCLAAGRSALLTEHHRLLDGYLLLLVALAGVLVMTRDGRGGRSWRIVRGLLVLYAALFTLLLPIAFGILVREPIYPAVEIVRKDAAPLHGLLLERSDGNVLLWSPATRTGTLFPSALIMTVRVVGERDLFERWEEGR